MVDVREQATLRGFHVSIADIDDQMHLCHPVLSFENDDALYLAHRLDWRDDPDAMAATDPDETSQGTLLPMTSSPPIASGQGVVAAGRPSSKLPSAQAFNLSRRLHSHE